MHEEKRHIFDQPRNVKRLLRSLYLICAVLFIADLFFHRHSIHPWESIWGFYPLYGFIACVILVRGAALLRKLVMRPEDYYERNNAQDHPHVDD